MKETEEEPGEEMAGENDSSADSMSELDSDSEPMVSDYDSSF